MSEPRLSEPCFSELELKSELKANLKDLGYLNMTPIQAQSLPLVLAGKDVIAKAKTGSGKTAAFGVGLINRLEVRKYRVQGLILCPTRELADQVSKELRRIARALHNIKILTLCGGMPFGPQIGSLEHGAHIVVGTPGRILQHLRKGTLKIDAVSTLVLDEADRMLDMGFVDDIREIAEKTPKQRQTLLFSATYPESISELSQQFQRQPQEVSVDTAHKENTIEQYFFPVEQSQRDEALLSLIQHYQPQTAVIFVNTKRETEDVAGFLREQGWSAQALHGDLEQKQRDQVLVCFSNNSCSFLVATDVAARGLDIKDLPCVINYQVTRDAEVHVHRIGRTGRSGKSGLALNLFSDRERYKLEDIETYQNLPAEIVALDDLTPDANFHLEPQMATIQLDGGRKAKIRPGDILGALTGDFGIDGKLVGKIDIFNFHAYVALDTSIVNQALKGLQSGKKIKGRTLKVRKLKL